MALVDELAPAAVRGQRRIAVSFAQLGEILHALATGARSVADGQWPDDLEVQRVHVDHESDSFEVFVTSTQFERIPAGHVIPYFSPHFRPVKEGDN